jgi:uncharacterized protein YprB with RNaseH-like and TPR domain
MYNRICQWFIARTGARMLAPVHRLKLLEIRKLAAWRCKEHSHSGLVHYNCYLKENVSSQERIGFLDIEASNLTADWGVCLCYFIKPLGSDEMLSRTVTAKELKTVLDQEVIRQAIKDISQFDRIITFYGARFDIPFLRSRALKNNLEFPVFGSIKHNDCYFMARARLRLSSNRLENVCRFLYGETNKDHILPSYWIKALQGDKESLGYITEHCKKDVIDLERVWLKLVDFVQRQDRSI